MKTILTIGGIGLLAYALYEWLLSQQTSTTTAAATQPASGFTPTLTASSPTSVAPPTVVAAPAQPVVINAASLDAIAAGDPAVVNGLATVYVWNYYYSELSGVHQTFSPPNPTLPISSSVYLAMRQSAGLSGFRGVGRYNRAFLQYPLISRMTH